MLKDTVPDVCLLCLREVASGRKWLPPEFVQSALDRRTERNEQAARFHDLLTQREQEVVFLVATGLSNKAIANRLRVSEGTIKIHLHNIYKKLPVTNSVRGKIPSWPDCGV